MKLETQYAPNPDIKKIGGLIKGIKIAMLVTMEMDGILHGRPMMTSEVDFDGTLWFFSNLSSGKNKEIRWDHNVQVSYVDVPANRYISLSGDAIIVRDKKKAEELWYSDLKEWFPLGLNDPELSLIKINVMQGEYWDGPSQKMVSLLKFIKGVQGKEKLVGGEHKKFQL